MCQSLSLCLVHSLGSCCQIGYDCRAPPGGGCPNWLASNGLLAWLHAIEKQIYWFKCFRQESNPFAMEANEYFYKNITGQIEYAYFPIGFDGSNLFCRWDVVAGPDWQMISGTSCGVTQNASTGKRIDEVVFNMPLEIMYKSTNPYGCECIISFILFKSLWWFILLFVTGPQIVFSLYGTNWWGTETSKGYARLHVPLGGCRTTIRAPILVAQCTNIWSSFSSWFTDRNPELRDPKTLLDGTKVKGLNMQTYGELVVTLQSITKGSDTLCLEWSWENDTKIEPFTVRSRDFDKMLSQLKYKREKEH